MKLTGNERFDNVYRNSRDRVYRTAYYYTKRRDIAEDIMQDTFMELYADIDSIDEATEENWLLKVAKNKSLNWLTRNNIEKEKLEYLEENREEIFEKDVEGNFLTEERNRYVSDLSREIFEELKRENENWYEAVTRVYCMEKPQREVAAEMNIKIEVLHATLYRARKWIKRKYKDRYDTLFGL